MWTEGLRNEQRIWVHILLVRNKCLSEWNFTKPITHLFLKHEIVIILTSSYTWVTGRRVAQRLAGCVSICFILIPDNGQTRAWEGPFIYLRFRAFLYIAMHWLNQKLHTIQMVNIKVKKKFVDIFNANLSTVYKLSTYKYKNPMVGLRLFMADKLYQHKVEHKFHPCMMKLLIGLI